MAHKSSLPAVTIYTDGACQSNPGPGGYGVILQAGKHKKELSRGYALTTNNRMELLAVIAGLEALKEPCQATVYSDSQYVCNAINKRWVHTWNRNNWIKRDRQPVKNPDLWRRFLSAQENHKVKIKWIKGHAGIPENERCDELAVKAANSPGKRQDTGYESERIQKEYAIRDMFKTKMNKGNKTRHTIPGEPCRKCGAQLEKRTSKKKPKPGQSYYFLWYLYCPGCKSMYIVESAKRRLKSG